MSFDSILTSFVKPPIPIQVFHMELKLWGRGKCGWLYSRMLLYIDCNGDFNPKASPPIYYHSSLGKVGVIIGTTPLTQWYGWMCSSWRLTLKVYWPSSHRESVRQSISEIVHKLIVDKRTIKSHTARRGGVSVVDYVACCLVDWLRDIPEHADWGWTLLKYCNFWWLWSNCERNGQRNMAGSKSNKRHLEQSLFPLATFKMCMQVHFFLQELIQAGSKNEKYLGVSFILTGSLPL